MDKTIHSKAADLAFDILESKLREELDRKRAASADVQAQLDILHAKRDGKTVELDIAPDHFRKAEAFVDKQHHELVDKIGKTGEHMRVFTNLAVLEMPTPRRPRRYRHCGEN